MGRPRKFDEAEALGAALDVFWTSGFEGASTTELAGRMGIGAQSLYNTFGDKRALFDRALAHYRALYVDALLAPLEAADAGLEGVRSYFDTVVEALASDPAARGCFLVKSTVDLGAVDPAMAALAREHFDRMEAAMTRALTRAKKDGMLRSTERPRALAKHLVVCAAGLSVLARSGADRKALRQAARVAVNAL
ncbi:MAG: TetR/AcrR family transcriptional regulator [Deltaproteobacteria bacterium]